MSVGCIGNYLVKELALGEARAGPGIAYVGYRGYSRYNLTVYVTTACCNEVDGPTRHLGARKW